MSEKLFSSSAQSYVKQANELAVDLSLDGYSIMTDWLVNRIHFLTEPITPVPADPQERFKRCVHDPY
jgi:hypothetical protein